MSHPAPVYDIENDRRIASPSVEDQLIARENHQKERIMKEHFREDFFEYGFKILPRKKYELLYARNILELTYVEISKRIGVKAGTLRKAHHEAVHMLSQAYQARYAERG